MKDSTDTINDSASAATKSKPVERQPEKANEPPPSPPVKRAPVAAKNKFTMGEDYDDNAPPPTSQKKDSQRESQTKKTFGENKLPTFEELMASEELKNKTPFNYDSD